MSFQASQGGSSYVPSFGSGQPTRGGRGRGGDEDGGRYGDNRNQVARQTKEAEFDKMKGT